MVVRQTVRLAAVFCCSPCFLFADLALTPRQRTISGRSKAVSWLQRCETPCYL